MWLKSLLVQTVFLTVLALFVSAPTQAAVAPASAGFESAQAARSLGDVQGLVEAETDFERIKVATYGRKWRYWRVRWHRPRHRHWRRPYPKRCFYHWKKKKKHGDDDDDGKHAWQGDDDDGDNRWWGGKGNKYKKHYKLKRRYARYGYGRHFGRYKARDRYWKYRRYVGYRGHKRFKRWKKWRRYYHGKPWWKRCPISK